MDRKTSKYILIIDIILASNFLVLVLFFVLQKNKLRREGIYNNQITADNISISDTNLLDLNNTATLTNTPCSTEIISDIVRGSSMEPFIKNGQVIQVAKGYYNCHDIKRDDVVIYNYSDGKEPLIKMVKGIEGDTITLQAISENEAHLIINGQLVKNHENKEYVINAKGQKMLSLLY